jgi:N-acetylglucosamine-6-phosphate deacetylase
MGQLGGYLDLQVNGYGGIDFQDDRLTPQDLHDACASLRADGTEQFLATIVTEQIPIMEARLRRIVELREQDPLVRSMVPAIHIEGPFISPVAGYRGAHPVDAIRPAEVDLMKRLLDAGNGLTKLVTLAPENDPGMRTTKLLAQAGIRVSAGHTNATLEQLQEAIDAGLTMFTHLGNGCPMQMHRHDNIVQRALSLCDELWLMFIADGAHVAYPALGNYLRTAGLERTIVVTDAVAPAGKGAGRFKFGRWDILIGDDLVVRAPDGSHLVGSALSMPQAMRRLIECVGLTREQALKLTVHNPRMVMGYDCTCELCKGAAPHNAILSRGGESQVQVMIPRGRQGKRSQSLSGGGAGVGANGA